MSGEVPGEVPDAAGRWTVTWCAQCGPDVAIDEDGCCATCGATATGEGAERAARLEEERDEARGHARVLAHAYQVDCRPPGKTVKAALEYPVIPDAIRRRTQ